MFQYIFNIVQVLISPTHGWDDISRRGQSPEQIANNGFYPLLGLAAASEFLQLFYTSTPFRAALPGLIEAASVTFVKFFLARFIALAIWCSGLTPRLIGSQPDETRCDTFILYSLGLLALTQIVANCVPVTLTLIEFLPFIVLVEMWMGYKYVGVNNNQLPSFLFYSAITILLPAYIISTLFSLTFQQ